MRRDHHQRVGAGGLGGAAVVDGEIGAGGAGVDHDRNAARHVPHHSAGDGIALGLVELEDLRAQRDAEPVHAGRDVEVDQPLEALLVDAAALVKRRNEDRHDAL